MAALHPLQAIQLSKPTGLRRTSLGPILGESEELDPTEGEASDDEVSPTDARDVVAMLGKLNNPSAAASTDSPQQPLKQPLERRGGSIRVLKKLADRSFREASSASSTPGAKSNASSYLPNDMQSEISSPVSWKDVELYCEKLDAESTNVRIESLDLSCMEEDESGSEAFPNTVPNMNSAELGAQTNSDRVDGRGAFNDGPSSAHAALLAKLRAASEAKRRAAAAAAAASEASYSFASPSPSRSAKCGSPSLSASGQRECPLTLSPALSGALSLTSGKSSPSTSGQLQLLSGKASPGASSSTSTPGTSHTSSRMFTSSSLSYSRTPMTAMGGDIIVTPLKVAPVLHPSAFKPTLMQAPPVRHVSGAWPDKAQPVAAIQPSAASEALPPHGWSERVTVDEEAQKTIELDLEEFNSRPTRSTSMVVPGVSAARLAPTKQSGRGILGNLKAKCGELFSSSKKSKGRS